MDLVSFRVTNFRSVKDSGEITIARIGAFVGVNESGKTNLLTPLWKLNPAREGEIQATSDYPKKMFGEIREAPEKYQFISADFTTDDLAAHLSTVCDRPADQFSRVTVARYFDGGYTIDFPDCHTRSEISAEEVEATVGPALVEIETASLIAKEATDREKIIAALRAIRNARKSAYALSDLSGFVSELKKVIPVEPAKTSVVVPRAIRVIESLEAFEHVLATPKPGSGDDAAFKAIMDALPKFVYYSNYGNLDSEIYLPHVVHNLKRRDLGSKESAKARTLRVLFKFVRLSPKEILELGQDFSDPSQPAREPTATEVAEISEKKRERSILLQSAGTLLTQRFREWWKQGDYRFRFEADGDHFRIWVADDRRPEEIELESRSTGLQWFLSFYLVFLVESEGAHNNSILLLDEPGLSLHPLAQRDLSGFFEGLGRTNQLLYTTHSPFLVDADHLDRARKVYVAADGTTKATDNLREGAEGPGQSGAGYAVHSALNLSVAESLLLGCQPVIVEGASDQHYLTAIKTLLIRSGKITPKRELVFPPSGGTKTVRMVASILTGRDEILPLVLLDSDEMGRRMTTELKTSLYQGDETKLLSLADFVDLPNAEIEDLFPAGFIVEVVDRWQRVPEADDEFALAYQAGRPVIPQIEAWATTRQIILEKGWKVGLAKRVKQQALSRGIAAFDEATIGTWTALFTKLDQ